MNFRVNLAVAFAAAFSFACAEKSGPPIPTAADAHPGKRLLGLYSMTVTPVEGSGGKLYSLEPIPIGRDGNAATNPAGTVQVAGTFGAITTAGPGGCAGVAAITAPVRITNFAVDPLVNVWVDIVSMPGHTGNTSCNSTPANQSGGLFAVSDQAQGIWKYSDLAGSTVADGSVAGGTSLPLAAAPTGGVWGLRVAAGTGYSFYFEVWADNTAPVMGGVDPAGPNAPLTWTSTVSSSTNFELCRVDPGPNWQAPCPTGQSIAVTGNPFAGTGVGPWTFSYTPVGLVSGTTYYYRATNVFAAGVGRFHSQWAPFTYNSVPPAVNPLTIAANAAIANMTWTAAPQVTSTYYYLCNGACPNPLPAPPPALQQNVLMQGFLVDPAPTTTSFYQQDLAPALLTDALTATYFDPAISYQFLVFDYDGINRPTNPALGTQGSITITPVQLAPTITSQPATFSATALTWPVTWTADPSFTTTQVDMCMPDCANDPFPATFVVPIAAGSYAYDVLSMVTPVTAGQTFEMRIYNPDLYQVYGAGGLYTVVP